MRNILLAGAAALALSAAPASAAGYIGNVCGVPTWHHIGGEVVTFLIRPTTQLPSPLTPSTLYSVPVGASAAAARMGVPVTSITVQNMPFGFSVAGNDIVLRQALGQVGCFDVVNVPWTNDDGTSFLVQDHDVPNE